ncbi:hypothetical protein EVAR_33133_1 [Eumeta japonica]|uniref:Uncharacterized protein n=1 Tax=Eumeta variegata TaxID=151549 RepID=A0A4C1Y8A9_EUMVA|nr:hypothetical protein EVAR_33133_1 [Eumeta japonica]
MRGTGMDAGATIFGRMHINDVRFISVSFSAHFLPAQAKVCICTLEAGVSTRLCTPFRWVKGCVLTPLSNTTSHLIEADSCYGPWRIRNNGAPAPVENSEIARRPQNRKPFAENLFGEIKRPSPAPAGAGGPLLKIMSVKTSPKFFS